MLHREGSASYQELNEDVEQGTENSASLETRKEEEENIGSIILPDGESGTSSPSVPFIKSCLKNVFAVILLFIYLLLMAVAVFLVYQTSVDFREKLKHPVMSVSYKEVSLYDAPVLLPVRNIVVRVDFSEQAGFQQDALLLKESDTTSIAFYPGKAQLLSCKHHYYDQIPPLVNLGQPGEIECTTQKISYADPFTNQTMKYALIVQGPRDVRKRELVFLQFHLNETDQDFSAIDYLLFSSFQEFLSSPEKANFMKDCESSYSSWKFSGGFRTWVKMSLVKTKEEDGSETVEFKQETSVVNYIDKRPKPGSDQLFFVVFEWKDPLIQTVQDIVTANPWNMIALLCGIFLALFKAADFAKLSIKWMIKIRKRHLKRQSQAMNRIT